MKKEAENSTKRTAQVIEPLKYLSQDIVDLIAGGTPYSRWTDEEKRSYHAQLPAARAKQRAEEMAERRKKEEMRNMPAAQDERNLPSRITHWRSDRPDRGTLKRDRSTKIIPEKSSATYPAQIINWLDLLTFLTARLENLEIISNSIDMFSRLDFDLKYKTEVKEAFERLNTTNEQLRKMIGSLESESVTTALFINLKRFSQTDTTRRNIKVLTPAQIRFMQERDRKERQQREIERRRIEEETPPIEILVRRLLETASKTEEVIIPIRELYEKNKDSINKKIESSQNEIDNIRLKLFRKAVLDEK